jgi:hypothetical protein
MNRDIDIREHAVIIKFDHGHEEVKTDTVFEGLNAEGQRIRIKIHQNTVDEVVRIKVQTI